MIQKPSIIMIDDDIFFLEAWREALGNNVDFKAFTSPFDFEEACDENDMILAAKCIIVDFDFGSENAGEIDIISFLKNKSYTGKVLMCSILEDFGEYQKQIISNFDYVVKKSPLTWKELKKLIDS